MLISVETTDNTIAPKIAGIQPSIVNPPTKYEVINKAIALTTNINRPKVITVNGNVKKSKTGFIKVFITPKTIAARIAD